MTEQLNILLSSTIIQYFNYKNYHWHLQGQDFYSFHLLFDKHAGIIYETWDKIAERIRQMDGVVLSNLSNATKLSVITQVADKVDNNLQVDILLKLISNHVDIKILLQKIILKAATTDDLATADMLTMMLQDQDQMLWFIKSSLQN